MDRFMEALPLLVVLALGVVGVCLMLTAFVMAAWRGGWQRAMQPNAEGGVTLPAKLMAAGALLNCVVALLLLLPGMLPWVDYSSSSSYYLGGLEAATLILLIQCMWIVFKIFSTAARLERKLDALLRHSGIDVAALASQEAEALVRAGKKVEAIRVYHEYTGVELAKAKAAVDRFGEGPAAAAPFSGGTQP